MDAEEQEALSLKYAKSLSILALSSGRFALFLPFSNESGLPLAKIGTWSELEQSVREWKDQAEPEPVVRRRKLDAINLDELFG